MKIDPQVKEELKKYLKEKNEKLQERIIVTAGYPLTREEKNLILLKLDNNGTRNIFEYRVDTTLIAGVVITKGSKIIDLSLKGQLHDLRNILYESA